MSTTTPLEHIVTGNLASNTLIVFLQGWPDSYQMWDYIYPETNLPEFKLLKINFPNYGKEKIPWGQDFDVLVERLKATIDSVPGVNKRVLACHDWGCVYGYLFDQKYPEYFKQIIAMDVPGVVELTSVKQKILVAAYQLLLIVAFLIGGRTGQFLTKRFATISGHNPPYFNQILADRNYPYYYFWKNKLLSIFNKEKLYLKRYRPSAPLTYLYGAKKPFQFHGQRWFKILKDTPGSEVHELQAGHWFMKKFSGFVTEVISRRARL